MGRQRSRSRLREHAEKKKNSDEGSSVPTSNRYATLPTDVGNTPPVPVKRTKKRKKNQGQSDVTATNASDIGEFGDAVETENFAGPSAAKVKLPPLVVKAVPLNTLIGDFASLGIAAEYKLSRIGTKVMLRTKAEYEIAVKFLKDSNVEYFTHDIPGEKPFKVVIRGLPNFDPKAIEEELKDRYKLAPIAVFRITRRDENVKTYPDCLFLVHFKKGTVTLNALQAIRSIYSIIVRWEPYRGGHRDVTQCQRCLNFGHGTRNCNIKPRCSNCAQEHATSNCPADGAVALKCANCGGAHQGSDRQCSKREDFKRIRKQAATNNQPGRKKDKAPAFRTEDFPPLRAPQQRQSNSRVHSAQATSGDSAGQSSPSPPGFWRQPPAQNNNPDLFSADELMEIFVNMTGALRKCRNKPEQIQVLGKFIIQYGV